MGHYARLIVPGVPQHVTARKLGTHTYFAPARSQVKTKGPKMGVYPQFPDQQELLK